MPSLHSTVDRHVRITSLSERVFVHYVTKQASVVRPYDVIKVTNQSRATSSLYKMAVAERSPRRLPSPRWYDQHPPEDRRVRVVRHAATSEKRCKLTLLNKYHSTSVCSIRFRNDSSNFTQ